MDLASRLVVEQLRIANFARKDPGRAAPPAMRTGSYVRRDAATGFAVVRLPGGTLIQGRYFLDPGVKAGDPVLVSFSAGSAVPSCTSVGQSNQWELRLK